MKKLTKRYIAVLIIILFFAACSGIGSKILYVAQKNDTVLKSIGIVNLVSDSTNLKICPNITEVSDSAIKAGLQESKEIDFKFFDYEKDSADINNNTTEFCTNNNLDGIIFVDLRFINVHYTVAFIPLSEEYHSESKISLFNKNGKNLIRTSHNTSRGGQYVTTPSTAQTVYDAIEIALKELLFQTKKLNERSAN